MMLPEHVNLNKVRKVEKEIECPNCHKKECIIFNFGTEIHCRKCHHVGPSPNKGGFTLIVTSEEANQSLALQKLASKITNIPVEFCNGKTNRLDLNKVKAALRNYGEKLK